MGSLIKKSKERSLLIGLLWLLCLVVLIFRLFWLQTFNHNELLAQAKEEWIKSEKIKPKRGSIYDRTKGQPLAWEVDAYYFVADTSKVKDVKKTADLLAPILGIDKGVLIRKLSQKNVSVELRDKGKYKYPESVYNKVKALREKGQIHGIVAFSTTMRQYTRMTAAHLLGFVNVDGKAVGGIEQHYDQLLRGKAGFVEYLKAKNGMMISDAPDKNQPPQQGKDLVLTIDSQIQSQVELELEEAIKNYQAKGGTAIVADPHTGEILAMASRPTFNPNQYATTLNDDNRTNRAIESQFEPGSTFKIVTLAAAIEEGIFNENKTFQSGAINVAGQIIRDWNGTGWGNIDFKEGVKQSSNVAFVLLGKALGPQKLAEYIDRFGFGKITERVGKKTGIDLPAEERGVFFGRDLYPAELAATSFGQGVSVTPIQQVAAISAVANGGKWVKPHVLKEVWEPHLKKKVKTVKPESIRIIQESTAKKVRELLRDVVRSGTGTKADLPGYRVAGKTGTAQKPDPVGNGYLNNKYMVSFIGFAPYDHPDLVIYVAIDEPFMEGGEASGGSVAAPVAKNILEKALPIRKVQRNQYADGIK
ncbi:peptidoglycan D,D-transpeptidase FtsI family protein [Laceyella putida]|uniref:Peptidoglycan D,D-transpeptidase FtsI family protein n=1 Tax=Laceyella putida TaxID=110101 RepID=A0ABW2RNJ5_9BACL